MAENPAPALLDELVCFNLHAASRAMNAAYRPLLEPLGLTYPQYLVLVALGEHGDITVGRLAELLQLDYGTMTPLLKRLEQRGLVARTRRSDDERVVLVTLTEAGAQLHGEAPGIQDAICRTFGLTPAKMREMVQLLQTFTAAAAER